MLTLRAPLFAGPGAATSSTPDPRTRSASRLRWRARCALAEWWPVLVAGVVIAFVF